WSRVHLHDLRRLMDGLDDVLVAGASAQVPLEGQSDLRVRGIRIDLEQIDDGHDHAGGAEAALQAVLLVKRLLHGMEVTVPVEALDRCDLSAVGLDCKDGARLHGASVEMDGAGAANGRVAADLRAGEIEVVAEKVDEQRARLDLRIVPD